MGVPFTSGASIHGAREMLRRGRISDALAAFEELLDPVHPDPAVLAGIVECRLARGEHEQVAPLTHQLAHAVRRVPDAHPAAGLAHWALAGIAELQGDHEVAAHHFRAAGEVGPDDPDVLPWRAGLALALVRLGQAPEAVELAHDHLYRARSTGSAHARAQALRTVAAVDVSSARRVLLTEALAELEGDEAPRLRAQILTDLSGVLVLLHEDRGPRVIALLREAEAIAGRASLRPLLDRVRRLLERLDQPPGIVVPPGTESLTPSQLRVVELAGQGLTNREIAAQLVVTVKAVEWHLSNVYRKLGIKGRAELPG
ncbi:helix-turn-helix transcriptional regulator [Nocardioides jensenii]|uniref:helix-turn-helix transcriptional regulator n=1 Tax=Nocardioides jensenii TaxID=1843 RepID=UPI00082BAC72|nr:LuxR C-terminal-related transcriptional regulator [Nocardioides jensenii]